MDGQYEGGYQERVDKFPEVLVFRILSGENGVIVIQNLMKESMGFNELLRNSDMSSAKTLSNTLKKLISNGIVKRELTSIKHPSAVYRITERGRELATIVSTMHRLGVRLNRE